MSAVKKSPPARTGFFYGKNPNSKKMSAGESENKEIRSAQKPLRNMILLKFDFRLSLQVRNERKHL
jgi:hypothetical protein